MPQQKQKPQGLSTISAQQNITTHKQDYQKQQFPPQPQGEQNKAQKRQEDNDCLCEFKLTVKEKYQQKLKHEQTDQFFVIIVNQIIQERIRRNYYESNQSNEKVAQIVLNQQEVEQIKQEQIKGPSFMDKLKAEDEQVKKRIKQLMRKKPKKKELKFQLDPNRDKGFVLAKRMNQIKQQREKKFLQNKQAMQQQQKKLIQSQFATIDHIQNFSINLVAKRNRGLRSYQSTQKKLPKIMNTTNMKNDSFTNVSKNSFFDFLNFDKNQKGNSQVINSSRLANPQNLINTSRFNSLNLSSRYSSIQSQNNKGSSTKRDLQRQIQILKKSQKITQKYELKKIIHQIIDQMILNSVKLVETKKQFFFNAPPKPVHEMIRNYKDKHGKTVWIPGSKPEKFRINVHLSGRVDKLSTVKGENCTSGQANKIQYNQPRQQNNFFRQQIPLGNNISRLSRVSHSFDISIINGSSDGLSQNNHNEQQDQQADDRHSQTSSKEQQLQQQQQNQIQKNQDNQKQNNQQQDNELEEIQQAVEQKILQKQVNV